MLRFMRIDFSRNTLGYREEAYLEVHWEKSFGFSVFSGHDIPHLHTGGGGGKGTFRKIESAKSAILKLVAEKKKEGYTIAGDPYILYGPVVRIEC